MLLYYTQMMRSGSLLRKLLMPAAAAAPLLSPEAQAQPAPPR